MIIDPLPYGRLYLNNDKTFNSGLWWDDKWRCGEAAGCGVAEKWREMPGAAAHLTTPAVFITFLHPLLILIPSSWHFSASAQNVKCPPDNRAETSPQSEDIPRAAAVTLAPPPEWERERWPFFAGVLEPGWAGLGWAGVCYGAKFWPAHDGPWFPQTALCATLYSVKRRFAKISHSQRKGLLLVESLLALYHLRHY